MKNGPDFPHNRPCNPAVKTWHWKSDAAAGSQINLPSRDGTFHAGFSSGRDPLLHVYLSFRMNVARVGVPTTKLSNFLIPAWLKLAESFVPVVWFKLLLKLVARNVAKSVKL